MADSLQTSQVGDGGDSEACGMRQCWETPIARLEIAVTLDNSALGKYSECVGNTESHLTATERQCAVPCTYVESQ